MFAIDQAIRQLQDRKQQAEREIQKLNLAINALRQLDGNATAPTANAKRGLSVAARRKIGAAQKARWAKIKAGKK